MTDVDDELRAAASRLGVPLASDEEAQFARARAFQLAGTSKSYLWQHCDRTRSENIGYDANGWRRLASMLAGRPNMLFTEEGSTVWKLRDGEQLEALLGETHHFEFYVLDLTPGGAMYCFNHHDALIRFSGVNSS